MRKQKRNFRVLSILLSLVMMLTMMMVPSMSARAEESGVGGFVNRCYQVTLGRDADEVGYADWTSQLSNGVSCGANIAYGFVCSEEYKNANKSNGDYVTDMYKLFLDRTPDEIGYNDWVSKLDAGADRMDIFTGFANSPEFYNICLSYGITAGFFSKDYDRYQVNDVNSFVARMYRICLNRIGDQGGQEDWVGKLLRGEYTGNQCAHGFIFSQEYTGLNLSNADYVANLYRTFMGREADEVGFNDWMSKLNSGYTRDEVFAGFANSVEFSDICNTYGIVRGEYAASDVHTDSNSDSSDSDYEEHGWRLHKTTYPNGQYTIEQYNRWPSYADTRIRYAADGTELGIESQQEYDANGRPSGYTSRSFDDEGKVVYFYRYTSEVLENTDSRYVTWDTNYDENGAITGYSKATMEKTNGSRFNTTEREEYDAQKNLKYVTKYQYENGKNLGFKQYDGNNVLQYETSYKYDDKGNRAESTSTNYYNGEVTYRSRIVYEYNEAGGITKTTNYNSDDQVSYYSINEYDGDKLKTYTQYLPNGTVSSRTVYTYNEAGNTAKVENYVGSDNLTSLTEYEYDEHGNQSKETYTSGGTVQVTKYEYEPY